MTRPHVVLDWDYRTFDIIENGDYVLYDFDDTENPPDEVIITGPDDFQKSTIAKRVSEYTYRLVL